jgi:hypothetical protein
MKIRISDLSPAERLELKNEVIARNGNDFWEYVVATDKPIAACVDGSGKSLDYWVKIMTEGDMSKVPELLDYLVTNSKNLIGHDLSGMIGKKQSNAMIVGRWYGATDGTSNDVVTIFKYNGKLNGRIGWGRDGRWSTNLDNTYDRHSELVPENVLTECFAAEAKNRGYDFGVNTRSGVIEKGYEHEYVPGADHFFFSNIKVYKDGDWNNSPITDANDPALNDILPPGLQELLRQIGIGLN